MLHELRGGNLLSFYLPVCSPKTCSPLTSDVLEVATELKVARAWEDNRQILVFWAIVLCETSFCPPPTRLCWFAVAPSVLSNVFAAIQERADAENKWDHVIEIKISKHEMKTIANHAVLCSLWSCSQITRVFVQSVVLNWTSRAEAAVRIGLLVAIWSFFSFERCNCGGASQS